MLIIQFICRINFVLVFKYCILLILRYTYSKSAIASRTMQILLISLHQ